MKIVRCPPEVGELGKRSEAEDIQEKPNDGDQYFGRGANYPGFGKAGFRVGF